MLDAYLRPLVTPVLDRAGCWLARRGFTADGMTVAGFVLGIAACIAIASEAYGLAFILIAGNRIVDGLDGAVARHSRITDYGGFIDLVADFLIYAAVPFAFAIADHARAFAAGFLILSFVGTGTTFLAFAAIAARRNMTTDRHGPKSLYYLGGLAEGTETILVFLIMTLVPRWFDELAYGFGALCWLTTAGRVWQATLVLRDENQPPHSVG
jgi:phosphatidylglycerophosphate synthase